MKAAAAKQKTADKTFDLRRWYVENDELLHVDGKTYAVINQWGQSTQRAIDALLAAFPSSDIQVRPSL